MKLKLCTALLTVATIFAPLSLVAEQAQDAGAKRNAIEKYGRLPLSFEPTDSAARFLARNGNYTVSVGASESSVAVTDAKSGKHQMFRFAFDNASPNFQLQALEPQAGVTNYYIGKDPAKWRLGVKSFAKLRAPGVYPGVDVVYYGDHRQLEFDFVIAPKADPGVIALSFAGMDKLYKSASGDLVAELGSKSVHFVKPYAYQKVGGISKAVDADYEVAGNGKVQLRVGDYDHNSELIVDPVVSYATYLGGSAADVGNGIAVDSSGNVYVTGQTCSISGFPITKETFEGACDAYVTKYNAGAASVAYSTVLGGTIPANSTASGNGIALDKANPPDAYIVGTTNIKDLPFNLNSYQGGDSDAFIAKLGSDGSIKYISYLGGSGADAGYGIAVDQSANVIAVGQTCSQDFPGYNAFETKIEPCVAFITKLDNNLDIGSVTPGASALAPPTTSVGKTFYFSEFYGGQPVAPYPTDGAWTPTTAYPQYAIVLDNQNPPHIELALNSGVSGLYVPATTTTSLPTPNWNTTTLGVTLEGTMEWEDLGTPAIPANAFTEAYGVALDPQGDVFVAGGTDTAALASTIWPCSNGAHGAWILKVYGNAGGCAYEWTLESTATDVTATIDTARAVAVDSEGRAYVTGTASGTIGTTGTSYKTGIAGGTDAFLFRVNQLGSAIDYATYLGGSGNDQGLGVAVDGNFSPYVTGATQSVDFPTINPLTNPSDGNPIPLNGTQSAFITKFTPDGSSLVFSTYLGGSETEQGNGIAVVNDPVPGPQGQIYADMYVAGNSTSTDLLTTLLSQPMSSPNYAPPQATNAGNGDAFIAMVPGASIPSVTVSPGSLSFGTWNVGATSTALVVTYTNTNTLSSVQINSVTFSNSQFQQSYTSTSTPDCAPGSLVPPSSATFTSTCQIWVIFTPSAQSLQVGSLTITDDATSAPHVINLRGSGAVPFDTFVPTSLAFAMSSPYQAIGSSTAAQSVTVTNIGTGTLEISNIAITGTNLSDFSQTNNCSAVLASGGTCTISVVFTPSAAGARSAALTIIDNAANSPHNIPLQGTGAGAAGSGTTSSGSIKFSSTATFSSTGVGIASASQTVILTNTSSTSTLAIPGFVMSNTDFTQTNNCPASLPSNNATCSIQVIFTPSVTTTETGTLTVSGTTSPSVSLTGGISTTGTTGATGTGNFTLTPSATAESVTQGNQAAFTVAVAPLNSYSGTITFTCMLAGGKINAPCGVSPSSVTLNGTGTQSVTVTVNTADSNGSYAKLSSPGFRSRSIFLALLPFSMMGILLINKRRGIWLALTLLVLCMLMGLASCGGGGNTSTTPLAAGTYSVTLTGSPNGGAPSATMSVVVTTP
jgi:hypothetical protein